MPDAQQMFAVVGRLRANKDFVGVHHLVDAQFAILRVILLEKVY
jgi:hypothetical protein